MAYQLRFGTYTFPRGFYPAEEGLPRQVGTAKLPRTDGARALVGYLEKKKIVVRGGVVKGPFDSTPLRSRLDTLRSALATGPANLYFNDDRYWRSAQAEEYSESYEGPHYGRIAAVQIGFIVGDPFQYDIAMQTDTWTITASGQTRAITNGGNAYALPAYSITVGGSGVIPLIFSVTNQTTGEMFVMAITANGGDVIVVDTLLQKVLIGGVDKMAYFDGQWPRLAVGANTLLESYSSGTISQIVTQWQNRYW